MTGNVTWVRDVLEDFVGLFVFLLSLGQSHQSEENEVPVGTDHTSLRREWKHLYNFVKGGNDGLSSLRRETMFIQMLEGLHPEEAKILCLVKDKCLQTKYKLTYDVVAEAYPDIQWGGRS